MTAVSKREVHTGAEDGVPDPISGPFAEYRNRLDSWSKRHGLPRKFAFGLAVAALASGVATGAALTGTSPFGPDPRTILILLNLDLILFLLLGAVVARRLVRVWMERRRGSAGSQLHTRFVLLFSLVALTPAIIVSIFSAVFFNFGIQAWFSERVGSALKESLAVADAYLEEHQQVIRGDILAMARDLNRAAPYFADNPKRFRRMVATQGVLRSLNGATVFDSSGRTIVRWALGLGIADDPVPGWVIERARKGETVLLASRADDKLRAVIQLDGFVDGFLYVSRFVSPQVLDRIKRTKRDVAQYEKLEGQRSSIEITFAMMYVLVALLLLVAAIWVGLTFATRLAQPVSDLVGAAERVRAGDLSARVSEGSSDDEISLLSRAFNRMTEQLGTQRQGLVDANRQLDERRHFIETVLSGVTSGVIGLDADGRLNVANRRASELLADDLNAKIGITLEQTVPELAELLQRVRARTGRLLEAQINVDRGGQGPRTLLVRVAIEIADDVVWGYVVTIDDITELLSAQRKAAWSDVARRIAHEIKNPLTPIQLAAERLRRKYLDEVHSDPETFAACTDTIIRQVSDIGKLVDEFSAFARMPSPVMKTENLAQICRQAMFMHSNAHREIEFVSDIPEQKVEIRCDGRQVGQALTNLLQNAVESIEARQAGGTDASGGRIAVALRQDGQFVFIEVADNGKGLPRSEIHRLTEPYVTSREKGTGLGLAIVKKIMEDHGGDLMLENLDESGARIRLRFVMPVGTRPEKNETAEAMKNAI